MNTPKTLSLPLRAEWRPIESSYAIKDATGTIIAYTRGGRSKEEALFLAHAAARHTALVEGLEKAAAALESMAGWFELYGRRVPECEALAAKEAVDLLLAQAKGVNHDA